MTNVRVYALKTCDTCRKALRWLAERGVPVQVIPVREAPPSRDELRGWMAGKAVRACLNTSSRDYAQRGLSGRELTVDEALDEIGACPNLIKRPLTVWGSEAEFGFKPQRFEALLASLSEEAR